VISSQFDQFYVRKTEPNGIYSDKKLVVSGQGDGEGFGFAIPPDLVNTGAVEIPG
jgi:hypothetical protein